MIRPPLERIRAATVARRYFLERQTKSAIAGDLGISRFKVARLLDEAIEDGVVRFLIADIGDIDTDLSARLAARFRLRHAVVLAGGGSDSGDATVLGPAAASLLDELLVDGQVLGLAWGRTLAAMAQALTALPHVDVVQAAGSLAAIEYSQSSVDLVHRVAGIAHGRPYPLYAPMWVEDAELVDRLRKETSVAQVLSRYRDINVLVSGIGSWQPPSSCLHGTFPRAWRDQMVRDGVRADLCTVLIDDAGREVPGPLADNALGLSAAQLRAIPEVVGVAGGMDKADAILAVLRGGWLTTLVTDAAVADALLEQSAQTSEPTLT